MPQECGALTINLCQPTRQKKAEADDKCDKAINPLQRPVITLNLWIEKKLIFDQYCFVTVLPEEILANAGSFRRVSNVMHALRIMRFCNTRNIQTCKPLLNLRKALFLAVGRLHLE
jgi:hypothetical protein